METVLFEINNNVATITFNRPDSYNSVNKALATAFINALNECANNTKVRAVIITGNGKAFCAGQDLKEVSTPKLMPGFDALLTERYTPIIQKIIALELPVIAAVNGIAAGAGANIALACDIIVATEKANFIQAFSAIGLIPDSGGTFTLPRLVGRARAMAYTMLGDKIDAATAEQIGMIYKCYPTEIFEDEVQKMAARLSQMPTKGLALTKRAINASYQNTFTEQLQLEKKLQIEASETEDYAEGVAAFIEKRKSVFKGK